MLYYAEFQFFEGLLLVRDKDKEYFGVDILVDILNSFIGCEEWVEKQGISSTKTVVFNMKEIELINEVGTEVEIGDIVISGNRLLLLANCDIDNVDFDLILIELTPEGCFLFGGEIVGITGNQLEGIMPLQESEQLFKLNDWIKYLIFTEQIKESDDLEKETEEDEGEDEELYEVIEETMFGDV